MNLQCRSLLRVISPLLLISGWGVRAQTPAQSTFFANAAEEAYSTYQVPGNGDLWPTCWADDDNVYTANGDGTAFYGARATRSMAVSQLAGMPPNLVGTSLAKNLGTNWNGSGFNVKPTGMLCRNGSVYLAFQNLDAVNFNSAPAASIARSDDHGASWTWDTKTPMFGGTTKSPQAPLFTTIFFLDFGKNSVNALDGYVYAYGLDNNWRSQSALYLARVPPNSVQTRSTWQFYSGSDASGVPQWTSNISQKAAVLTDTRMLYPVMFGTHCPAQDAVVAQGGVVYDAPLQRYLFTAWSCSTHEIYEAPDPWGPWKHVLSNDFGPLRGTLNRGQYGTSIPSKYISADGKTLLFQSNVCCSGDSYTFSLRKLYLRLPAATYATNAVSNANLALAPGTRALSKSTHFGSLCGLNCSDQLNTGPLNKSEDDFDEESKSYDWWGYTWPQPYNLDEVVYQTGSMFSGGGWFSGNLQVQVYQNGAWLNVPGGATVTPAYPYSRATQAQATFTFDFLPTWGSGVRILGVPGGASFFTSIGQLGVYYGGRNLVQDPSFEAQGSSTISSPWKGQGPGRQLIDVGGGTAHTGANDGYVSSSATGFNAIIQIVAVKPNTSYTLTGWVQDNFGGSIGSFRVYGADGVKVVGQTNFGAESVYAPLTVTFNSGSDSTVTVFTGFAGQNTAVWMRVDDVALR